jgi:hypothetical protein
MPMHFLKVKMKNRGMLLTIFICLEAMTLPQIAGIKLIHIYTNWTMLKNIDMLSKIKS